MKIAGSAIALLSVLAHPTTGGVLASFAGSAEKSTSTRRRSSSNVQEWPRLPALT